MNKKSLLDNLKSTKKANVIKAGARNEAAENKGTSTRKARLRRAKMVVSDFKM